MDPIIRRQKIMELLTKYKKVDVKKLSKEFNVSDETIRRDLNQLENEKKLIKTHGGAKLITNRKNDVPISIRKDIFKDNKNKIGKICSTYINNGDTIFLDASTTSYYIIPNILDLSDITIITNSLIIANYATSFNSFKIILLGGEYDPITKSFLGPDTVDMIDKYYADSSFVSCRGISAHNITDANPNQGYLRTKMLEHSNIKFLILDNTKFDLTSLYRIGDFKLIDYIITDSKPRNEWIYFFKKNKIKLKY